MQPIRSSLANTVAGLPREFWWLWTGTLVNRAGAFVLPFLAIYLTQELHYSTAFTGIVLGAYGLGSMASALIAGVLSDRLGRRPVLLWSQVASAATLVALGLVEQRFLVAGLTGLVGFTTNATRPALSAMMADVVPPPDRVRAFSLQYWAVNLGFATAAVLAGLFASSGYLTLFLVDAATTLVFGALVYFKVPETHPEMQDESGVRVTPQAGSSGSMFDVLRDGPFLALMLLTFGFAVVFMQHISTLPVQMADDGLSPAQYGVVISLNAFLIVLVTVPLTRRVQHVPSSYLLAASALFLGIGFGATALATTATAYAATVVVWTIGELLGSAIGPAVVADLSPQSMRGRYQGAFNFTFSVASLVAPIGGGWVYDHWGGDTLWGLTAVVSFAGVVGHLLAGPARAKAAGRAAGAEHAPTAAVAVPAPETAEESDQAVR